MKFWILISILFFGIITDSISQNLLKTVAIYYKQIQPNPDYKREFDKIIPFDEVNNAEIISGTEWSGIQPVGIIQNVSDRELTFKSRFRIKRLDTNRVVYNRGVPVSKFCLSLNDENAFDCMDEPYIRVRYCSYEIIDGNAKIEYLPFPGDNDLKGIPPGGFVEVHYPPFFPNENFDIHKGSFSAFVFIDPINPENNEPIGETDFSDDTLNVNLKIRKKLCAELLLPKNGDTVDFLNNWFVGLSSETEKNNCVLEFSFDKEFQVIEHQVNQITAKNLHFENNRHYYWRLKVYLGENCTSETGDFYTNSTTGIKESNTSNIKIYPNPTLDYITIQFQTSEVSKTSDVAKVQIFDVLGIEIMSESIHQMSASHRMNVEKLPVGVYFIRINAHVVKFEKL